MNKTASILLFACLVKTSAFAQDVLCNPEGSTMEMARCAQDDFEKADKALNKVYADLLATAKTQDLDVPPDAYDGAVKRLKEAQRAWIAWRDLECPLRSLANRGGSIERIEWPACAAQLTQERTRQLEAVAQGLNQ
jgi:uncharacterized protein YecT (DUF1311 family)